MKRGVMVAGSLLGAILGAVVAYIGVAHVFVCRPVSFTTSDGGVYFADCASPDISLALSWGVPIRLAVGFVIGLVLSWRASSNRDITVDPDTSRAW
jgi:hypothetical protein